MTTDMELWEAKSLLMAQLGSLEGWRLQDHWTERGWWLSAAKDWDRRAIAERADSSQNRADAERLERLAVAARRLAEECL